MTFWGSVGKTGKGNYSVCESSSQQTRPIKPSASFFTEEWMALSLQEGF